MSSRRAIAVDDTDSRIQYTGSGWFQDPGPHDNVGNYGPAYKSTLHGTISDGSLSFNFAGTQIIVYGLINVHNNSGVLDPGWQCFVDNINIGNTSTFMGMDNHWQLCSQDGLLDAPHILTVNITVTNQQTFWFDNIQYVPSSSVPLDNEAIVLDHRDPELNYGSGWTPYADGTAATLTQSPTTTFTYSFIGVSLSWFSLIPTDYPRTATLARYTVDNYAPVQFSLNGLPTDSNSIQYNQKFFETPEFPMGTHQLIVTYLGNSSTTPLSLEYIVVQNGSFPSSSPSSASLAPTTTGNHTNGPKPAVLGRSNNIAKEVVGGVVGGIVLIILAIIAVSYFCRRDRKQSARHLYNHVGHDSENAVEPFQLVPSILPAPTIHPQNPLGIPNTASGKTKHRPIQHRLIPNQTTKKLKSIFPPRLIPGGNPPPTGSSQQEVSTLRQQNVTQQVMSPQQDNTRTRLPLRTNNGVVEILPTYTTT
ncbi:hypothetical protein JR316_0004030 [Psilocybe cubensis]|uniref:Transmembrane protein n=2 Tax=Psilocybe cubensis TaxID=181762 RepID=A0A8H8CPC8_PSICU|nr:hypothetical protein JR316_0004030 [Psilocybe cubensis]KAH9484548.1 hypothetical protein JR316_0004030 [Psilocybe cubensis]